MTILDIVLLVKILGTAIFAALPMVLLPASQLVTRLGVGQEAIVYLRLYGVAILALLVGYSFGFSAFTSGVFPWGVVTMGIVSNGLGTLTLFLTGGVKKAKPMTALIGSIAVALIFCAINPTLVTTLL